MRASRGSPTRWRRQWGKVRAACMCAGVCGGVAIAAPVWARPGPEPVPAEPSSTPASAEAALGDARQLLDAAKRLYDAQHYADALDMFERVYALEPNPAVLFNIGAVHAALHHCELARDAYRRYIEQTRLESGRADAHEQLERLKECESTAPEPVPAATVEPEQPPSDLVPPLPPEAARVGSGAAPVSAAQVPPTSAGANLSAADMAPLAPVDAAPSGMRVAGWVAIGAGGVLGLASLGCAYASWRTDDADSSASPRQSGDAAAREQDAGRRYNALAWGLAGGAVAVAGSGLLLLWLQPDEQTSLQAAATGGGLALSLERKF